MRPLPSFHGTHKEPRVRFTFDPNANTIVQMQRNVDCLLSEIQRGVFTGSALEIAKANAVKFARRILRRQGIEV
jgi:hypothetical protein